jgi:hypothetical protein
VTHRPLKEAASVPQQAPPSRGSLLLWNPELLGHRALPVPVLSPRRLKTAVPRSFSMAKRRPDKLPVTGSSQVMDPFLGGAPLFGYPFNAGQLEDGRRDLKCREARPSCCGFESPKSLCYRVSRLKWIPRFFDGSRAKVFTWTTSPKGRATQRYVPSLFVSGSTPYQALSVTHAALASSIYQ